MILGVEITFISVYKDIKIITSAKKRGKNIIFS